MTSSRIRVTLIRFAFCIVLTCPTVFSQSTFSQPTEKLPAFEVASIRTNETDSHHGDINTENGTLTIQNVNFRFCIQWAYDIQDYQLTGPAWLGDLRLDIRAKAGDDADGDRLRLMLRSLLAERFGLKLHHEQKELSVFFLTLAKNGPKLHPAGANGSKFIASTAEGSSSFGEDKTGLAATNFLLSEMAAKLSRPLKRPVIDKTGMQGRYDMRVDVSAYLDSENGDSEGKDHLDPISVVQGAFQEQLGLKLQADKAMVDFVVIDYVNKTVSEN